MTPVLQTAGALGQLGIQPVPVDTLGAVKRAGFDPSLVASCAPPAPGVRGCPMWKECPFHLTKYGGFKRQGPKNVIYRLITDEGGKKEDYMSCVTFVRTMVSRMRAGQALREKGQAGDYIRVIGQEGDEYVSRMFVKVDPNDKREEAAYHEDMKLAVCPKHPRIGDAPDLKFDALMREREAASMAEDPDFQTGYDPLLAGTAPPEDDEEDDGSVAAEGPEDPLADAADEPAIATAQPRKARR